MDAGKMEQHSESRGMGGAHIMNALVTGATGFIGATLVEMLAARGDHVRALVRRTSKTDALEQHGAELVYGDVRDPDSLRAAAEGVNVIFHSAALVGEWGSPKDYHAVNVQGMSNMLAAAERAGVPRFIDVSSVAVHGNVGHDRSTEDAPMKPSGVLYSSSKYHAEKLLWEAHAQGRVAASAVRPVMVWGPGDRAFMPKLIVMLKKRMFSYIGDGRTIIGLAHVRNVCDVLLRAADNPAAEGKAFIVHDGTDHTVRDVVETLCRELDLPRPKMSMPYGLASVLGAASEWLGHLMRAKSAPMLTKMGVEIMGNSLWFDISRARSVLGYEPQYKFPDHLPEFLDWYKKEYDFR